MRVAAVTSLAAIPILAFLFTGNTTAACIAVVAGIAVPLMIRKKTGESGKDGYGLRIVSTLVIPGGPKIFEIHSDSRVIIAGYARGRLVLLDASDHRGCENDEI